MTERPFDLGTVERESRCPANCRWLHSGCGAVQDVAEVKVAIMAGKPQRHPVLAIYAPEGRDRFEFAGKEHSHHWASRISTSGMLGASPASKLTPEMSIRSSSKRTGTSKRNPARTSAPCGGAEVKLRFPPGSSDQLLVGTPETLATIVSMRGRVIRRTCGSPSAP